MSFWRSTATAMLLCLSIAPVAHAATFTTNDAGDAVLLTGEIERGDDRRLRDAMTASCNLHGTCPQWIYLNSDGGNVLAAAELAVYVHKNGLNTIVGANTVCASACVLIFAAGPRKVMHSSGTLAVHSAAYEGMDNGSDGQPEEAPAATVFTARFLEKLNVPDRVIAKMVQTPPEEIYSLHAEDWPSVEIVSDEQPGSSSNSAMTMTCNAQNGARYTVVMEGGYVNTWDGYRHISQYAVIQAPNQWIAIGTTRWGSYRAVFSRPNPYIVYTDEKETVTDKCW